MELTHHRGGAGEPLVLIHGIGSSWQAWLPVLPALQTRHDVIAVDLPGFGASPPLACGHPLDGPRPRRCGRELARRRRARPPPRGGQLARGMDSTRARAPRPGPQRGRAVARRGLEFARGGICAGCARGDLCGRTARALIRERAHAHGRRSHRSLLARLEPPVADRSGRGARGARGDRRRRHLHGDARPLDLDPRRGPRRDRRAGDDRLGLPRPPAAAAPGTALRASHPRARGCGCSPAPGTSRCGTTPSWSPG